MQAHIDIGERLRNEFYVYLNKASGRCQNTGFVPYDPHDFLKAVDLMKREGYFNSMDKFLELGHGLGTIVIAAATRFDVADGIELNNHLNKKAIRLAGKYHRITKGTTRLVAGNYYTENIRRMHMYDVTISSDKLDSEMKDLRKLHFLSMQGHDGFDSLNRHLPYYDVFFNYAWGAELPLIVEMFGMEAKSRSVLLSATAIRPQIIKEICQAYDIERILAYSPERNCWQGRDIYAYVKN